ncbi:hypothetical protein NHQ30_010183 [Ciborinia camelliae]|nr:hypothetical protein NHQ30_010183 [Ciborinia camelliae]
MFFSINNGIPEYLAWTEPFYRWLISQVSTLALEIAFEPLSNPNLSSGYGAQSPFYHYSNSLVPFTPTREQNMWIYSLAHPSKTVYLTFQVSPTRSSNRPTFHPHSPSFYPPDPLVNKYADRTSIMEYEDEIGTNVPWSKLLPKPKFLPDPTAIIRREQMAKRLEAEKKFMKNSDTYVSTNSESVVVEFELKCTRDEQYYWQSNSRALPAEVRAISDDAS